MYTSAERENDIVVTKSTQDVVLFFSYATSTKAFLSFSINSFKLVSLEGVKIQITCFLSLKGFFSSDGR